MLEKTNSSNKYIANYFTFLIFLLTLTAVFFLSNERKNEAKKK